MVAILCRILVVCILVENRTCMSTALSERKSLLQLFELVEEGRLLSFLRA